MRILFLLLICLVSACQKQKEPLASEKLPAVDVKLAPVVVKSMPVYEAVVGTVRPRLEATVSSDILGRILEYRVVSGQKVKKGDLIARLDAQELEASQVRAEAALQQMVRELKRQKKLLESNATSRSRFEQVEAAERMARASLVKIKASLAKSEVRAPFTGIVTRKLADTGDLAVPGKPLLRMEDPTSLRLEIPVAESLAGALKLGEFVSVEIEAANLCVNGTVGELEPAADSASRTFLVKIDLPSASGIRAGLFGRAWVPRGDGDKLLVPASAVIRRGQMELAFVAVDGVARLRLVRTVPQSEGLKVVLSGLSDGEQVVLDPPVSLRDGAALRVNPLP
jgi:RND family efflux transporter MFP subunit